MTKKSNLYIDVYKGEINTFITVRHIPTDISLTICTKRDAQIVLKKMLDKLRKKVKRHQNEQTCLYSRGRKFFKKF